jgi:SAM-dependent methyltransferase
VPYTAGRGLDLGCGRERLFDSEFVTGVDDGSDQFYNPLVVAANLKLDVKELTPLASGGWDYVYSSFVLQEFPYKDVPNVLREWLRVLKVNGNLCLYLPDADQYPKCAEEGVATEPGAFLGNKWNVTYDRVVEALKKTQWNWDLIDFQVCDKDDEYALWFVIRKLK